MPIRDHHDKPFDEATLVKLSLFEAYIQAWLPTFTMSGTHKEINIFDFFAGPGKDIIGVDGSPIRILNKVKERTNDIINNRIKVNIILNEYDKEKFEKLKNNVWEFLNNNSEVGKAVNIKFENKDFDKIFFENVQVFKSHPSLLLLDQNGIKFMNPKYFNQLSKLSRVDFLYFVSSSYVWRFSQEDEITRHLGFELKDLKRIDYKFIHETLINGLRSTLDSDSPLKLYPFSIKKGSSINGIIFGASHPKAFDKYLSVAWKENPINGSASFDINDHYSSRQLNFFEEHSLSQVEKFQIVVKDLVLSGQLKNNKDVLVYCYENGHPGKHAKYVLEQLKKNNRISYDSRAPCITYEKVFKENKIISFIVK